MPDEVLPAVEPDQLVTVGQGRLANLLTALVVARKQLDPSAHDHGRSAVCHALRATVDYISGVADKRPDLVVPLRVLLYGLKNLDDGIVVSLLKAKTFGNRPPDPTSTRLFRADAAVLMQLKFEEGSKLDVAGGIVARHLNRLGYQDRKKAITGRRVVVWRETVMGLAGTEDIGAGRYQFALKMLMGLFPDDPKAAFDCFLDMMPDLDLAQLPKKQSLNRKNKDPDCRSL